LWDNVIDWLVSSTLLDERISNGRDGQDMLNVVFLLNVVVSLNFYEVYMITENSEDILVSSIGH